MNRYVCFLQFVLCFLMIAFFSFSPWAAEDTGEGKTALTGPQKAIHQYLEALKAGKMADAEKLTAGPDLVPPGASQSCTVQTQRIIRENSLWKVRQPGPEADETALVEAVLDEPDINPLIEGLVRSHLAEALQSKGSSGPNERLCEIIGRELSRISKTDIQALPRKETVQCYRLKKFEGGWKITGRESSSCLPSQGLPDSKPITPNPNP